MTERYFKPRQGELHAKYKGKHIKVTILGKTESLGIQDRPEIGEGYIVRRKNGDESRTTKGGLK